MKDTGNNCRYTISNKRAPLETTHVLQTSGILEQPPLSSSKFKHFQPLLVRHLIIKSYFNLTKMDQKALLEGPASLTSSEQRLANKLMKIWREEVRYTDSSPLPLPSSDQSAILTISAASVEFAQTSWQCVGFPNAPLFPKMCVIGHSSLFLGAWISSKVDGSAGRGKKTPNRISKVAGQRTLSHTTRLCHKSMSPQVISG